MIRHVTLPPPRTPDPLFDDFIPPRLASLMRRIHRRGGQPTPLQHMLLVRLLKAIDPRLEPLVDDVVERADGADGCIMVFMDLVGPEVSVGAALTFKLLGGSPKHVAQAWRIAEQKVTERPEKGTALEIAARLLGVAAVESHIGGWCLFADQATRLHLLDEIFADVLFFAAE